jgi:hypothetical protein
MRFAAEVLNIVVWLNAAVLLLAGALKLNHPRPAAGFLARVGLAPSVPLVRAAALVEVAVGFGVLAFGGLEAALAAACLDAAFLGLLAYYHVRTGKTEVSCGCFGSSGTVPLVPHMTALAVAVIATLASTAVGLESFASVLTETPLVEALLLSVLLVLTLGLLAAASSEERSASTAPAETVLFRVRGAPQVGMQLIITPEERNEPNRVSPTRIR